MEHTGAGHPGTEHTGTGHRGMGDPGIKHRGTWHPGMKDPTSTAGGTVLYICGPGPVTPPIPAPGTPLGGDGAIRDHDAPAPLRHPKAMARAAGHSTAAAQAGTGRALRLPHLQTCTGPPHLSHP